jgi:hypothetical protein
VSGLSTGGSQDSRWVVVAARACLESYTAAMVEEGPACNLMVTEGRAIGGAGW